MTSANSLPRESNIVRAELDNGIVALAYENPAVQSVNLMGSLHAGSLYESAAKNGLASLAAGALMTGTATRSFEQLHGALEDNGADLGIRAHVHKVGYSGKALAEDLPLLLDVAGDALRNPVFPQEHVERLRGERLTWLQYSQFDTRYRAGRAMREALYPADHAYHYSPSGNEDTIPGIAISDLADFHAAHYGPRGMLIVVVGAVKADDAIAMANNAFGDWQNGDQPSIPSVGKPDNRPESLRQIAFVPGKTQSDISMGVVGPARKADDYMAAQLANSVLGEFGMMGRIGKSVREQQGLAYYAFSRLGGGHGPDPWTISAGVNPDNVEQAIDSIRGEIARLASDLVSEDDLADNQSYFTGRMPLQLESNEGIAAQIHAMESFGLGLDYLADYADKVNSANRQDLLAAARRYLRADEMVVAVAGPDPNAA